ncbi:MAG: hypothetical protein KC414_15160, partial [Romboutsia sp.]|nr:hypothetical protein [Romboutsia sp.]
MYGRSFITKKVEPEALDIPDVYNDSISDIAFNLEGTHMIVGSWDCNLRLYRISSSSFSTSQAFSLEKTFSLRKPILSVCFFNSFFLAGTVDGSLILVDLNNNQNYTEAHSGGIKSIKNYNNQFIITGSFDSTVKFWDLKSSSPIYSLNLPGKIYSMDLKGNSLFLALSDKTVKLYDINNINAVNTFVTKFNYSIRSISCSNDNDTFAVGGIEAKIELFSKTIESKRAVFRCHRVV